MTVIELDTGIRFEVKDSKLFLKEDSNYEHIERIERLIEILDGSEGADVIFRLDTESVCFEIEREVRRDGQEKYMVEVYPVFAIPLFHEFKLFKLSIDETSCILSSLRKFKEEEILDILNNASCAWITMDALYPLGKLIEYFTEPEIFEKNKLETGDFFNDFQIRLDESKIRLVELKSGDSVFKCSELVTSIINKIEELLDFFLEFAGTLNKIEDLSKSEISKIFIFSGFLRMFEETKNFLVLMIHVISRSIFGKKLVSLQLFSILTDMIVNLTYGMIALTARNIFDIDNLFKLEQDQRKKLYLINKRFGEAKKLKKQRNVSPLSHRFEPIDLSGYAEKIIEILPSFHNFLINLLHDNVKIIKKRVESEEDGELQEEIASVGVSPDDVQDYIYQLGDILSTINKFTPSEVFGRLKYLRNLYLNLFLLLSFLEEVKMEVIK